MKALEVVIKMAFIVFKKCKFPRIFCKTPEKIQFSEITLTIYMTKRENAFEKLNHISFVSWAVTENPNFRDFVISLDRKKTITWILVVYFFFQIGLKIWINCLKTEVLPKVSKKWKWIKNYHSESTKNQLCSSLFQRKYALFIPESALFQRKSALIQRWFLALKNFVFSAVQSWISAV